MCKSCGCISIWECKHYYRMYITTECTLLQSVPYTVRDNLKNYLHVARFTTKAPTNVNYEGVNKNRRGSSYFQLVRIEIAGLE